MKNWIKEYGALVGILTLALPVFAYLCAYLYEFGFCSYFSIPYTLIQVGWGNFTFVVIGLLESLTAVVALITIALVLNQPRVATQRWVVILIFGTPLCSFVIALLWMISWDVIWLPIVSIFVLVIIIYVIWFLHFTFVYKRLGIYDQGMAENKRHRYDNIYAWIARIGIFVFSSLTLGICIGVSLGSQFPFSTRLLINALVLIAAISCIKLFFKQNKLTDLFHNPIGTLADRPEINIKPSKTSLIILPVVMIFVVPMFFYGLGYYDACYGQSYPTTSVIQDVSQDDNSSVNKTMVILRIYGANAICSTWYADNESNNYINREFTIMSLENITIIPWEIENIDVR